LLELIFNITQDYPTKSNHFKYKKLNVKLTDTNKDELNLNSETIAKGQTYGDNLRYNIIFYPALLENILIPIDREMNMSKIDNYLNSVKSKIVIKVLWDQRKEAFKDHANERSKYIFALSNFIDKHSSADELINNKNEIIRLRKEKNIWEATNPNPMEDIANLLNPIISKFGLKTRIDIYNLNQLNFLPLMDKDENDVPEEFWSTGTNQIIYKTYPLFALKPENAIILIDEPENSLYPDIQTDLCYTFSYYCLLF